MIQPRTVSAWMLLGIVVCLFALAKGAPRSWDEATGPSASPGLAARPEPDRYLAPEQGRSAEVAPVVTDEPRGSSPDEGDTLAPRPASEIPSVPLPGLGSLGSSIPAEGAWSTGLLEEEAKELQPMPPPEFAAEPVIESPILVAPAGRIGAQAGDPPEMGVAEEPPSVDPSNPPDSIHRLPLVVANTQSPIRAVPAEAGQSLRDAPPSETRAPLLPSNPTLSSRERAGRVADDAWRDPETLLDHLGSLAAAGPTSAWATEVMRQIRALGAAVARGPGESMAILERLAELDCQAPQLAEKIADRALAKKLKRIGYALGRRIDVWQEVVRLGTPQSIDSVTPKVDPQKLALCLADVDALTRDSVDGQAWCRYLLIDALKESAKRQPSWDDHTTRRIAQQVLSRLTQTPLTPQQQKFVATGPVAALRGELRRWAAEPVGAAALLRDIETYERSSLPSDALRLALDCQSLTLSPVESRRQLAERIDLHYRNANLRIAATEELLNKLIPERNLEYSLVDDTVLGYPVWGESLMATEVGVRMSPDPRRVRMVLEVRGEISSATTANAGAARFHNDSESSYVARKPLEIDMNGVSVWPVEVGVENQTHLRGVETPLDAIPLLGAGARLLAKSQSEQNRSAATEEVRQKIAAEARARVDAEARRRLAEFVDRMNQRVFDPLNSLSLDPQLIAAETTEKRFTMRLRLAGEDQLGSHTPRPQAPADSLASMQIHESVLNNGIQRLQLNGRTFTLSELSQHVAARLNRPAPWQVNPDHADVKIAFAEKDAVIVRCRDGKIVLTLSIAQLSKSSRKWKNFQIQAFYRPKVEGRSAELVRDGVIHLKGPRLSLGTRIALDGIFSRALSKNNSWELVPEPIVKEPKLADAAITQFVIDDGWIGVSLGPKPPAASTARRSRWGLR